MPVTRKSLRLQHQLEGQLDRILDQQVRDLTAAWVRAYDETAGDLDAAIEQLTQTAQDGIVAKALVVRNARLRAALDYIGRQLTGVAEQAGVRILGDLSKVVADAAKAQTAIVGAQIPDELDLASDPVPAAALEAIVRRSATQITAKTYPLGVEATDAVRRELLRGIVVGANPRHTADRILARAEGEFNGGLTRALTIARSETLDAHRAGAAAGQAAHSDVLAGWVWTAHLSPDICPACLGMNGRVFPLSTPGPLGHPNCKCARVPKTKTWADLGLPDLDEPADVVPDPDATRAWFEALPREQQLRIMGPERLDLLSSGQVGWDDLARLQPNPGWRESWTSTPVKDLQASAA